MQPCESMNNTQALKQENWNKTAPRRGTEHISSISHNNSEEGIKLHPSSYCNIVQLENLKIHEIEDIKQSLKVFNNNVIKQDASQIILWLLSEEMSCVHI
ncbi:hypothetical protein OIU76_014182 [Salix suchowensis]|nr:hypothetical protein OIU76_014182 [Salix suchowensis]